MKETKELPRKVMGNIRDYIEILFNGEKFTVDDVCEVTGYFNKNHLDNYLCGFGFRTSLIERAGNYFIKKGCFLIIATHLGLEIKDILPEKTRIDGIEAKGLDENFELIVDHNPVLGRLAHSTPELIIESLAKTQDDEYYQHIYKFMKTENNK